ETAHRARRSAGRQVEGSSTDSFGWRRLWLERKAARPAEGPEDHTCRDGVQGSGSRRGSTGPVFEGAWSMAGGRKAERRGGQAMGGGFRYAGGMAGCFVAKCRR